MQPGDLDALYRIALATGDSGADAARLYRDPKLVERAFTPSPYAVLAPEFALVVEDDAGVGAYIVGAADTLAFEARMEAEWWPALRAASTPTRAGDPERTGTWIRSAPYREIHHHAVRRRRGIT